MPNPDGSPTAAEIDDFVARNGGATGGGGGRGDRGRAVEALTNYTGDRDFDSQGPMYDQRTNALSPAGQTATMALQQRRRAMPMGLYGLASTGQAPMGGGGVLAQPMRNWGNYSPTQGGTRPMPSVMDGLYQLARQGRL